MLSSSNHLKVSFVHCPCSPGVAYLAYDAHAVLDVVTDRIKAARRAVCAHLPVRACLLATAEEIRQAEIQLAQASVFKIADKHVVMCDRCTVEVTSHAASSCW